MYNKVFKLNLYLIKIKKFQKFKKNFTKSIVIKKTLLFLQYKQFILYTIFLNIIFIQNTKNDRNSISKQSKDNPYMFL